MYADGGACEECRYNQLASPCCRAGLLRRSPRVRRGTSGEDRISALPDDLRLKIISHLDCVRAAANMSLLSRKWNGLWRHLPKLVFHNITPDPLIAALGQVPHPAGSSLNIYLQIHHKLSAERISSILRAAAPIEPANLHAVFFMDEDADTSVPIELPIFDRATSIKLSFPPLETTLLPTGDFTKVETLSLTFCNIDLCDLLPRCPKLRKLKISCEPLDSIKVHSDSLEELDVYTLSDVRVIDIATPKLKKLRFASNEGTEDAFSLSFSAPLLDDLLWQWWCKSSFGALWRMWTLKLKTIEPHGRTHLASNGESSCLKLHQRPHNNILLLKMGRSRYARNVFRSFGLDISRIPVRFSILELDITTGRHVYGAVVLEVLGFCTSIQRLKIMLNRRQERKRRGTCRASCPCDRPRNWRSQSITLTNLKEVEVEGFSGEDHEVDLLKVIFRSTTMLEGVTLKFSRNVSPECSVYKELPSILDAHPSVKFNIYSCYHFQES
uniref:F-box domain-containing protein n=2 Tax=Setaria italica TaxID=4555 RepID=K4A2G0_SETIT